MQPVFRSTDTDAPALSNTNGSLVDVLDAVLVNGYGAKAPLGWTIAHTDTHKRVYQQGAGSGFQLRIEDWDLTYNAHARGAESFNGDFAIGSGAFPTAEQVGGQGLYIQKTNNTAGNRAWAVWGDTKRFIFLCDVYGDGRFNSFYFGDIVSFKPGDAYACIIIGKTLTRTDTSYSYMGQTANLFGTVPGHYLARGYTGTGSAVACGTYCDLRLNSNVSGYGSPGSTVLVYPDPVGGGLHLSRFFVSENAGGYAPRGYLPGVWVVCHNRASMAAAGVANGDTFNGSDGLASRSFEFRNMTIGGSASDGAIAIETSDWAESA